VLEHLVDARLLDVEDLTLEGQDRLVLALAALLGRASGRITFDDVELGVLAVARRAVGQLAGKVAAGERALPTVSRARRAASRACDSDIAFRNTALPTSRCFSR
jgi:hypothetical protein